MQARSVDTPPLADNRWFEEVKKTATPEQLYTFLYAMPKGGDLHNHLTGAARSEWMWDAAHRAGEARLHLLHQGHDQELRALREQRIRRASRTSCCSGTSSAVNYARLDECQRSEFKRLQDLDAREKQGWLDSLRLDKPYEGRNEFFSAHWQRMNDLYTNPYWIAEILYKNMEAFGKEGLLYLETENGINGMAPSGRLGVLAG